MGSLAIIGGSGFHRLPGFDSQRRAPAHTPYGDTSAALASGTFAGLSLLFLPRHGDNHSIPPHRINYRANLRALADAGAGEIIALAAVGGIAPDCGPGALCVPDQLIDYSYGRAHSFFAAEDGEAPLATVTHVDFTDPYDAPLRRELLEIAASEGIAVRAHGCYAVSQGPRLETAAEIRRFERDGCDLVGMTGMPEAALARELGLRYATLAFVVNWAAGKGGGPIAMDDIETNLALCAGTVQRLLRAVARARAMAPS